MPGWLTYHIITQLIHIVQPHPCLFCLFVCLAVDHWLNGSPLTIIFFSARPLSLFPLFLYFLPLLYFTSPISSLPYLFSSSTYLFSSLFLLLSLSLPLSLSLSHTHTLSAFSPFSLLLPIPPFHCSFVHHTDRTPLNTLLPS
ncbi:hypothetical protein K457DRAFT_592078 [Linnemannia elongata AG-77]|uniref:Uncharacterized protein n=1 Tax=Linnemannia elongata AG-77 TaxID=1314771 RepID=A0A197JSU8_9FUNG|nr:hypothetical protein K457DRAFT_592078 [Linnemannia elongata AG-77]